MKQIYRASVFRFVDKNGLEDVVRDVGREVLQRWLQLQHLGVVPDDPVVKVGHHLDQASNQDNFGRARQGRNWAGSIQSPECDRPNGHGRHFSGRNLSQSCSSLTRKSVQSFRATLLSAFESTINFFSLEIKTFPEQRCKIFGLKFKFSDFFQKKIFMNQKHKHFYPKISRNLPLDLQSSDLTCFHQTIKLNFLSEKTFLHLMRLSSLFLFNCQIV